MGGGSGVARRAGRALVLLGAVLLLLENVLSWVGYVIPTLPEVLDDVWLWGLGEALSGGEGLHRGVQSARGGAHRRLPALRGRLGAPVAEEGQGARPGSPRGARPRFLNRLHP